MSNTQKEKFSEIVRKLKEKDEEGLKVCANGCALSGWNYCMLGS